MLFITPKVATVPSQKKEKEKEKEKLATVHH